MPDCDLESMMGHLGVSEDATGLHSNTIYSNQRQAQPQQSGRSKSGGPYIYPRSQLGQLLDPTGKGVS